MNDKVEIVPTTEVALKVYETKPAVVSFNYKEISDHLDSVLAKYKGLVFTDSTATDCKKTIAELRKGQKSLDEFRKATKKQLTESVTVFENECKTLYSKFEEVIKPLSEQQDQFELDRREKKRVEIQGIIDALVTEKDLNEKFSSRLTILEEYFNKGKSIKVIKTELSTLAASLKIFQDKEEQDINLIATKVDLANAQYQLTNVLLPRAYLMLLSYKSIAEIEALIIADAQTVKAREDKATEELAAKAAELPKIEPIQLDPEPTKAPEFVASTYDPIPTSEFTTQPRAVAAEPFAASPTITAVYEITGTEEQLSALEAYLDANNYTWIDRA